MEYVSKWYEEGKDEIKEASFLWARDVVRKGDSLDFISWFCGIFSLACLVIVSYFGISNGIRLPMIFLMVVYILIAVFSLCQPVQVKISKFLWGLGFKRRIAINKEYEPVVQIDYNRIIVKGEFGEESYLLDKKCFFIESSNYIILNITDKKLFPVSKAELEEEGILEDIAAMCVNSSPVETESFEEEAPSETESVEEAPVEAESVEEEAPVEAESVEEEVPVEAESVEEEVPDEAENVEEEAPVETENVEDDAAVETENVEDDEAIEAENAESDN